MPLVGPTLRGPPLLAVNDIQGLVGTLLILVEAHICTKTANKLGHTSNNNKASKGTGDKTGMRKGTDITPKSLGA